jgi:hypothetical protein
MNLLFAPDLGKPLKISDHAAVVHVDHATG